MFGNTLWTDFDRAFFRPRRAVHSPASRELFRSLERLLDHNGPARETRAQRLNLVDKGDALELVAALPGVRQEDLEATLEKDVLTLSARRTVELPEGHKAHRQERTGWHLRRSFALPVQVDADATRASLKDGILRVVMPKAPEHQPRQITVSTGD